jgi:hypothetical protein
MTYMESDLHNLTVSGTARGIAMKDTATVLLVFDQDESSVLLGKELEAQGVKTHLVRNIAQANAILE